MWKPATSVSVCNSIDGWWNSLPFKLSEISVTELVRPIGFRFRKYAFNIAGKLNGKSMVATGEADNKVLAITKAVAEFIERCTLIDYAENNKKIKTSNGWAAHTEFKKSQENAIRELVERDAVLRHWYSRTPFVVLNSESLPPSIQTFILDELSKSEFPQLKILISQIGYGPSVTAVLMNSDGYGVTGNCSKESMFDAIAGAIEEACRLAQHYLLKSHLSDTKKMNSGMKFKVDTGAHGVFYAHQKPFPEWMFGECVGLDGANQLWFKKNSDLHKVKDQFKVFEVARDPLFVCRAENEQIIELSWGIEDRESLLARLLGKMPLISILEKELNLEPHIIP
ncbi:MAG: hypothetical protein B7Y39_01235 [Bdellovibrio sp. 28-41-41]|nr:MAG: hypothetical protein B7Y39_01235 [Bdellovibrio sp. 28-41-41]